MSATKRLGIGILWSLVPLAFFLVTLVNLDIGYHNHRFPCLLILIFLFMGSLAPMFSPLAFPCCCYGWVIKESMRGFAMMLFLFTLSASLIGLANYQHNIGPALDFHDKQWYHNVLPTEPQNGVADAIALSFAEGTMVSTGQSAGYKSLETGNNVYCAAPILNKQNADSGVTDFWAVGVDCCDTKSSFWCGDADDASAHDAIVLGDATYTFLSPRRTNREAFLKAVNLVRAEYNLPVREPLLLHWVKNAGLVKDQWAAHGAAVFSLSIGVAAGIAVIVGVSAGFLARIDPERPSAPLAHWRDLERKVA
eukprot:GEMP01077097.1.p1 GENE.GEMP01077097.1~~GEMP01077097.1.p1  ORF type:complete len:308 (+),score=66.49 GEMP01077097.1:167-1090(+)